MSFMPLYPWRSLVMSGDRIGTILDIEGRDDGFWYEVESFDDVTTSWHREDEVVLLGTPLEE